MFGLQQHKEYRQPGAEMADGPCEVLLDGFFADIQFFGDGFVGKALVSALAEDETTLFRQAVHLFLKHYLQ